jgi:tetratricopeptide (TPR) repeat protein
LRRRVQSDPASIAFAALAEEYRRAERFEEAIETCAAGLIRHPSYLSAHVTLGRALVEVGRLEDARNELEYVLRLAPENLAAIRALAEIHDRLGEAHEPAGKSQAHEAASPEMTVAEIHAASGFRQAAAEETAPIFTPAPVEPEPVTPLVSPTWEPEPSTPLVSPTWEPEPVTPPAPLPLDSRGTTARSGLPPWEIEPFAVAGTLEAEPAPSYSAIPMEETPAPEAPPVLASVSHIHETPADEPLVDHSTSSGSSRAKSRDDLAQVTRLEEFLQAILRARAERGGSR